MSNRPYPFGVNRFTCHVRSKAVEPKVPTWEPTVPCVGHDATFTHEVRRQFVPGTDAHHRVQSSSGMGRFEPTKTRDPGTKSAVAAQGKSAASGARSATVTWQVALTNRRNWAFVTG
jgi:hypothetical protein